MAEGDAARKSGLQQYYSQSRNLNERVVLTWNDVNYSVKEKDAKRSTFISSNHRIKPILKGVSGSAKSGELLAIMGPSGSGKTSLLNVLGGRVPGGGGGHAKLTGSITVNGFERNDTDFRKISAFVLQDDKLYPHLTVFETLLLASHFYMGDEMSLEAKKNLVRDVINELGLGKVTNSMIGDEKIRGISGGERKRASIGVQLIIDPAILFLDEPTSGLDSFQAQAVMSSMSAMADNGRLVVSVIHQPRSSIFDMFDKLLLLSEGRTMYLGPAKQATSYFATLGFSCPKLFNPSDYFLDILSPDNRTMDAEISTAKRIQYLGDCWITTSMNAEKLPGSDRILEPIVAASHPWTVQRFIRNFLILCWRSWTEQSREIPTQIIKLVVTTIFALVIGGIYSNSGYNQKGISNRVGVLFIMIINQGFGGATGVLNSFPKEKIIVNRERSSGAYDAFSYFVAKFFVEAPLNLVPCIIFTCILYWMVGLNPDRFGYTILIMMFEVLTAISLGLWISSAAPSFEVANGLGTPAIIIALLFAGYYINIESLPIVANWIPYFSFVRWSYQALAINEFRGETFTCGGGATGACITSGEEVLSNLSFSHSTVEKACLGLGMVFLGFSVCAVLSLHFSQLTFLSLGHIGKYRKNE